MKTLGEIKKLIEEHKGELRERFRIKDIGIFGSFVNVLVEFEEDAKLSLLDVVGLELN